MIALGCLSEDAPSTFPVAVLVVLVQWSGAIKLYAGGSGPGFIICPSMAVPDCGDGGEEDLLVPASLDSVIEK